MQFGGCSRLRTDELEVHWMYVQSCLNVCSIHSFVSEADGTLWSRLETRDKRPETKSLTFLFYYGAPVMEENIYQISKSYRGKVDRSHCGFEVLFMLPHYGTKDLSIISSVEN